MIREFLRKVFCGKRVRIGTCRKKTSVDEYMYFDENVVLDFEKFLGERYDYDITDYGMFVWEDPFTLMHAGYWSWPTYVPYGTYVVKEKNGLDVALKIYDEQEFAEKYEIV